MERHREKRLNCEEAEAIAASALGFIADRPEDLDRFMALSGIGPANLRTAASDPGFLTGVVDFVLGDDRLVVAFADHAGLRPERMAEVGRLLGAG